jgi:ATP-dependent helicase/nuclease subunit A
VPAAPRPRHWLPACSAPLTGTTDYLCTPSSEPPLAGPACSVVEDFGTRITLHGSPNMEGLGVALHHCLAMTLINPELEVLDVERILKQYPLLTLDADEVLSCGRNLAGWIAHLYPDARLHCELPFSRHLPTGQLQSGQIDLALELPDQWIVIDHKSNPQPKTQWCEIAAKHSGQLAAYADALADLSGRPVAETLIHFSVSGGIVRVMG